MEGRRGSRDRGLVAFSSSNMSKAEPRKFLSNFRGSGRRLISPQLNNVLQGSFYLDNVEGLYDISVLNVVIAGDTHTAFLSSTHFLHGILADLK